MTVELLSVSTYITRAFCCEHKQGYNTLVSFKLWTTFPNFLELIEIRFLEIACCVSFAPAVSVDL